MDVGAVGEKDVELAVVVVIEHGHASGHGFGRMAFGRLIGLELEIDWLVRESDGGIGRGRRRCRYSCWFGRGFRVSRLGTHGRRNVEQERQECNEQAESLTTKNAPLLILPWQPVPANRLGSPSSPCRNSFRRSFLSVIPEAAARRESTNEFRLARLLCPAVLHPR